MKMSRTVCIERDGEELELEVECDVSPFIPARGPSWDSPGEPAEGGEIEVEKITRDGVPILLSDEELGAVAIYVSENLTGDEFDDDYPEPDWRDDAS